MEEFKMTLQVLQTGSSIVILGIVLYHYFKRTTSKEDKNDDVSAKRETKLFDYIDKLITTLGENAIKNEEQNQKILERLEYQSSQLTSLIEKINSNQFCPLMKNQKLQPKGDNVNG
ncbi:MAG: hypothetical protein QMC67_05450 [Candidatus Wallbacteria bacterium]